MHVTHNFLLQRAKKDGHIEASEDYSKGMKKQDSKNVSLLTKYLSLQLQTLLF